LSPYLNKSSSTDAHLSQIAFSVKNLRTTHDFYRYILGFEPSGGTDSFRGRLTSEAQGLPGVEAICWWMVDQREFMQLELFEYASPSVRRLPADWRANDVGYTAVGIHVFDFDAVITRLERAGTPTLSEVLGAVGARRVCIRDPEGVLLELMEDDPGSGSDTIRARPELPVVVRSVTLSVPDLEKAKKFWLDSLGLQKVSDMTLHGPEHEVLWGLDGADRETLLLWADDFFIELVQYNMPKGRPWPSNYRISDQGILNIALGYRQMADLRRVHGRILQAGYRCNSKLLEIGSGGCVYCNDDQGFSVELLCSDNAAMDEAVGFLPRLEGALTSGSGLGGESPPSAE
jgi:catechol 2,3-dioxygenase-like lactoylglutathione lyase family enzyme